MIEDPYFNCTPRQSHLKCPWFHAIVRGRAIFQHWASNQQSFDHWVTATSTDNFLLIKLADMGLGSAAALSIALSHWTTGPLSYIPSSNGPDIYFRKRRRFFLWTTFFIASLATTNIAYLPTYLPGSSNILRPPQLEWKFLTIFFEIIKYFFYVRPFSSIVLPAIKHILPTPRFPPTLALLNNQFLNNLIKI